MGKLDVSAVWDWIEDELTRPADGCGVDARDMQPVYDTRGAVTELVQAVREWRDGQWKESALKRVNAALDQFSEVA